MKTLWKAMPWLFLALFATEIVAVLAPKKDGEFHVREFGRLPVLLDGRVQPFDSVGRNSLLQIRSTGDVPLEEVPAWKFWHHPAKLKSSAWLLELMCRPDEADKRPIFLIHHPDLLGELKLQDKGIEKSGLRYYTFNEVRPVLPDIMEQGSKANQVEDKLRTPLQRQVLKLANAVILYQNLKLTLRPPGAENFAQDLDHIEAAIGPGMSAMSAKEAGQPYDEAAYNRLMDVAKAFYSLQQDQNAGQRYPLVIPPVHPEESRDEWGNLGTGVMESIRERGIFPPVRMLAQAAEAYHDHKADAFNQAVDQYKQWLGRDFSKELAKGQHEFFFNDLKAFLHAMIIYIFAFILSGAALLTFGVVPELSESLRRSAFYLILLAGVVHTTGLIFRMVLEGRPPVTNLYSSAIFIGWGAVILGVGLERVYRFGIGNAVASLAGFITLIIAHNLALGGDTMKMLQAVLDTNFWLATHVVVVTLGYASTFIAGLLAVMYIILGLFTPLLGEKLGGSGRGGDLEIGKALAKMVYAIICFATLFSFVGTVLGGIWADQSWGRFWGWDPKENGALLIVLWNAAILHARWGGMVRERGLMNMAVFGNIATSFSYFGVNMLGIGLHSYGFMDGAFKWLMYFMGSQVAIILLGCLPKQWWTSFKAQQAEKVTSPVAAEPIKN